MSKKFTMDEMSNKPHRIKYAQTSTYQAVWLPYKGSTIGAVVVLPSPHLAQHDIAEAVTKLDVNELLDGRRYHEIGTVGLVVQMPRFKVQTESVSLRQVHVISCQSHSSQMPQWCGSTLSCIGSSAVACSMACCYHCLAGQVPLRSMLVEAVPARLQLQQCIVCQKAVQKLGAPPRMLDVS